MKIVELIGKFFDNHSLSIVNRSLALEFAKSSDIKFFITPQDQPTPEFKLDPKTIIELQKLIIPGLQPDIQIRHTYPPIWRWPTNPNTQIVFIQPWEFSKMPSEWSYKFEQFADLVIVPSAWVGNVYLEAGIPLDKVKIIPNGYDPTLFNLEPEESRFFNPEFFTFVFVGNGQPRKGIDILLQAWQESFVRADRVQLVIVDHSSIYGTSNILEETVKIQYKKNCGRILYLDQEMAHADLANIYKNANVLVHPYRGEGFGMHVAEASMCGAVPLVTMGGPTDEFLDPSCAIPINTQRVVVNFADPSLFVMKPGDSLTNMGAHGWILVPDTQDLRQKMVFLYHHSSREEFLHNFKPSTKTITWNQAATQFLESILTLNGKPARLKK